MYRTNTFDSYSNKQSATYTQSKKFQLNDQLNRIIRDNTKEITLWIILIACILICYKFFSDGSFSAILTLASAFQCFSLVLLVLKVAGQKTIAGISQKSILLLVMCLLFRLFSTLFFTGYLPVDKSGDWLYQFADILSLIMASGLLIYAQKYCQTSVFDQYNKDKCVIWLPLGVSLVLAILIHPKLNHNIFADISWTLALYLETFSMIPQLYMMGKLGGEVEALTSHYIASMAASKLFLIIFWFHSYHELSFRNQRFNIAGWAVLISYFSQIILYADFI